MRDLSGMSGDVESLRAQREARKNPPSFEAGQGEDDEWDFFGDSGGSSVDDNGINDDVWGGTDYSNQMGSIPPGGSMGGMGFGGINDFSNLSGVNIQGQMNQQPQEQGSLLERGIETSVKVTAKGAVTLGKGLNNIFKKWNYRKTVKFGTGYTILSIGMCLLGLLWVFLGVFSPFFRNGNLIILLGLFGCLIGFSLSIPFYERAKKEEDEELGILEDSSYFEEPQTSYEDEEVVEEEEDPFSGWGSQEDDEVEEESESDPFANLSNIWDDDEDTVEKIQEELVYEDDINIDSAIENITEIPAHTQTRQYLVEQYLRVLPLITPTFADMKDISESDDNFVIMDNILIKSALQVGLPQEEGKYPELLELRENSFILQLKAKRPSGLSSAKELLIANEIANIYSHNDYGMEIYSGVYATVNSVGDNFIINLFKGESTLVSLGDTYRKVKEKILDPKCRMPIVWGVSELGEVYFSDIYKEESFIFSGAPRSGKSWEVQLVVAQMCMYHSPKEIIFDAFDVKGDVSDYKAMHKYLPHFKKFETNPKAILEGIKYIVDVEGPRRAKLISDMGALNISDLKANNPEIELPYKYVIVDEMVSLIGELTNMGKEYVEEFQRYLNNIVTKMPGYGIRVILVPHRIVNEIISKTTYSLIPNKMCIRASFDDMKNAMQITQKSFPYILTNPGDMALKVNGVSSGRVVYSHGAVLTSNNDANTGIFKFIGSLWNKLDPEEVKTEVVKEEKPKKEKEEGYQGVMDIDEEEDNFWKDMLKDS